MTTLILTEPSPPREYIDSVGYYYLKPCFDGRNGVYESVVLRWSPSLKKWFMSGDDGTNTSPVNTVGWKYIGVCRPPKLF